MEPMLAYFMKSFKLRTKQITIEEAVKAAAGMAEFHAVELHYKGQPIRLIVASTASFESLNQKRPELESPSVPVVGKG